jgi:hypothetical protein
VDVVAEWSKVAIGVVLGMVLSYLLLAPVVRLDLPETDRLRVLEGGNPPFDVLMIGASYVEMQFIPSVFDAQLRKRGFEVRSLNLGVQGMTPYEQDCVLDAVLELELPDLRWLLIDISMGDSPIIRNHDTLSDRTIRWHDLRQVEKLFDYYLAKPVKNQRSFEDSLTHLKYVALHYGRVGQGVSALRHFVSPGTGRPEVVEAGYQRIPTRIGDRVIKPRGNDRPGWKRRLEEAKRRMREERVEPASIARVDEWYERVGAHGKEAIFVRAPIMRVNRIPLQGLREVDPVPFYDFAQPEIFPELYRVDSRHDSQHLTHLGATRYTKRLAEAFAAHLSGKQH